MIRKECFFKKISINIKDLKHVKNTKSIFDVVLDVNSYEKFIPFVRKSYVIERTRTINSFEADLYFDFFSYRSFVSYSLDFEKIFINITHPFEANCFWTIEKDKISFELKASVSYLFWKIIEKNIPLIVDSFIKRAEKITV